jgi:LPXTG-site transpeptidase (sortase) family protein
MKKILNIISKINKEKFFNVIIILIIIALYVFVALFIYSNFRERKRQEVANGIIDKVDEQIEKNQNNDTQVSEITTTYDGISYTVLGKIRINKINIYQPILKENTKRAYDASVVKMSGPELNTPGNVAIGGHNFMRGNFFIKINRLREDDKVTITDLSGKSVDYYVYEYGVTTIDDASYLAQPENSDEMIVTLVTCTKGGKERYYVKARAK